MNRFERNGTCRLLFAACGLALAAAPTSRSTAPVIVGKITSQRVAESSALAVADAARDLFYTLNDSGNAAEIWLIDRSGKTFGRWDVDGARNVDWEEITVAGDTLYVADTGDNAAARKEVYVHAFARPAVPAEAKSGDKKLGTIRPTRTYAVRYDDQPHDCEAVFVHGGRMYLLTKDRKLNGCALYSFDLAAADDGDAVVARKECAVPVKVPVTGAALSPDGKRLALCTVLGPYLFEIPKSPLDVAAATPRSVIYPAGDMESICFVEGGLLTTREGGNVTFLPFEAFGK